MEFHVFVFVAMMLCTFSSGRPVYVDVPDEQILPTPPTEESSITRIYPGKVIEALFDYVGEIKQ
jgi:hypothetical protein